LLTFFESEFAKYGAEICLDTLVREIRINKSGVSVHCASGNVYNAKKVVVTIALPVIENIKLYFRAIPQKLSAISKMVLAAPIKLILRSKIDGG